MVFFIVNRKGMNMEINAIDLFCGVLTYGLQNFGVNVVAGFDFESSCQFAYEHNNNK